MGCYDVFEVKGSGDWTNVQLKSFQSEELRFFPIGTRIPEAVGDKLNCNVAAVEGFIIEIRNGVYTGFKKIDPKIFIIENVNLYGYTYSPEALQQHIRDLYGDEYLKLPMYSKYGSKLF